MITNLEFKSWEFQLAAAAYFKKFPLNASYFKKLDWEKIDANHRYLLELPEAWVNLLCKKFFSSLED